VPPPGGGTASKNIGGKILPADLFGFFVGSFARKIARAKDSIKIFANSLDWVGPADFTRLAWPRARRANGRQTRIDSEPAAR
jgi:hypothetical protein